MDRFLKRDYRQDCKYGENCYQKNPEHKAKFKHPEAEKKVEAEPVREEAVEVDSGASGAGGSQEQENKENISDKSPKKKRLMSDDQSSETEESEAKRKRVHRLSSSEESQEEDEEKSGKITDGKKEKEEIEDCLTEDEVFEDLLPESSPDIKEDIRNKFLITMPEDFYIFFDFCKSLNSKAPLEALSVAGLKLCGPYDLLGNNIPTDSPRSERLYLTHGRFYYDPPEMCSVICETKYETGLHIGYFRDSPRDGPVFVVSGIESEGAKLTVLGDNMFAAVHHHLSNRLNSVDPFLRSKVTTIMEKLKQWVNRATMEANSYSLNLEKKTASMKNRDRNKVATTFHGAGLVVPYNKKTEVGYREIPETPASLKKILKNILEAETETLKNKAFDVLGDIVTNVQFANDEGDPGMGLELGLDLLCFGGERLHNTIKHLLGVAYELLDRNEFFKIVSCHLDRRTKGKEPDSFSKWR